VTRMPTRQCPQCSTQVRWPDTPTYPFCSNRCRLIDLGLWASGDYRIPTDEPLDEDAWLGLSVEDAEDIER
jgi:endogenous inhibitor of DNA gyrase (YacG/DUF329 family)